MTDDIEANIVDDPSSDAYVIETSIVALDVHPGDRIFIACNRSLTMEQINDCKGLLAVRFPGVEFTFGSDVSGIVRMPTDPSTPVHEPWCPSLTARLPCTCDVFAEHEPWCPLNGHESHRCECR